MQAIESGQVSLLAAGVPAQAKETVLYSFAGGNDGAAPDVGLTDVNGVLYGTTSKGGTGCLYGFGCGTVFKITTAGVESVLHSFVSAPDGDPEGGLTNVNGVLYGTTQYGGAAGWGTVFEITTSGAESILHSFVSGRDGGYPLAGLTNVNGVLYGTTFYGGKWSDGTVFEITTSGAESVLYSFGNQSGSSPKGDDPAAPLTNVNGVLYGTTREGGTGSFGGSGTVFKITTSGAESVLHSFESGSDGANPVAGLTNVNGVLYGTSPYGGANGVGTVFKVTTSGTETVLHSFGGGSDGRYPNAPLTYINGVLYGTTTYGGSHPGCCGTVFKITTSGVESVVYRFTGGIGGAYPTAGLTNVNGVLYGTTRNGGANRCSGFGGCGTVFSITL
jgi:uncharacterized repeat protein (TIGR03803 family)